MRVPAAVSATVVFALTLTACSSGPAPFVAVPVVRGVCTADAGRMVLLAYLGGGCDAPPVTRVAQTASVVTLTASIGSTATTCTDVGIPRVLAFHLSSPLGNRRVRNGVHGKPVPAFDGAVLTNPAWLPPGYTERTDLQGADVAGSWSRTWVLPAVSRADQLTITQSPRRLPGVTSVVVRGHHTVDGSPATVSRDSSRGTLAVQWALPGYSDSARVGDRYEGSRPMFSAAELFRIAAGLPAGS